MLISTCQLSMTFSLTLFYSQFTYELNIIKGKKVVCGHMSFIDNETVLSSDYLAERIHGLQLYAFSVTMMFLKSKLRSTVHVSLEGLEK